MAVANTIVRQAAGIGNRLLEIPLSALCRLPEVIRFFSDILSRPRKFHECYNQVLSQFRKDHSIRNDANPFPNLHTDTDGFELPFWLVHPASGTRSILWLRNHQHTPWLCKDQQPVTELHPGMAGEALLALMAQGWLLVHAGVVPQWTAAQTLALAAEVQAVLTGPGLADFMRVMYGNQPARADATLGMKILKYGSCGGSCGPNFCCCR